MPRRVGGSSSHYAVSALVMAGTTTTPKTLLPLLGELFLSFSRLYQFVFRALRKVRTKVNDPWYFGIAMQLWQIPDLAFFSSALKLLSDSRDV